MEIIHPASLGQFEFSMNGGRKIWLFEIYQWRTYGGLLCGYPNKSVNEGKEEQARDIAKTHFGKDYPITSLPPEITEHDFPPPGHKKYYRCLAFPAITSAAVFNSTSTSRNGGGCSSATIVWYQDEWGPPSLKIQKEIAALDWDEIAYDWDW